MLICPYCSEALRSESGTYRCANDHSFDIAREGYVNLASPQAAKKAADTKEMVEARHRFLTRGFYDVIVDKLAELTDRRGPIVDVGCGPAFYLSRLGADGAVGVDLSKAALKRAARALPSATFAVADVEEGIPIADEAARVVLSVFAPRPAHELRRILHPEGRLIVVAAAPSHLKELRAELDLLSVREDKELTLRKKLETHFDLHEVDRLTFRMELSAEDAADLVAMGPNAWHRDERASPPTATTTTADVLIVVGHPKKPLQ